ncbi:hypothetical protein D049_0473B, partial [Vibrio parahaemolyticus VPTS-2010]
VPVATNVPTACDIEAVLPVLMSPHSHEAVMDGLQTCHSPALCAANQA